MTKILITGGAGFIGSHLIDALIAGGKEVVVLDDFSSGKRANLAAVSERVRLIEGNVIDLDRLADIVGPVDRIVHLAALISGHDSLNEPDDYVRVNVLGTQRVIDFAARHKAVRIVFASSSTLYGNRGSEPIDEDTPPEPLSVYALTKLVGEHLLRLYAPIHGYTHCSLRLFNVFGPRQATDHPYANVTCKFSHAAANGLPVKVYGDGEQSRDFVYVADVVDAFLAVLDGSAKTIYNVGTGRETSINELRATLGEIAGRPLATDACPAWPNDIRSIRANVDRFATEFGMRPSTPLHDGLRRTVDFFIDQR